MGLIHLKKAEQLFKQTKVLFANNSILNTKIKNALSCDNQIAFDALFETLKFMELIHIHKKTLTPSLNVDLAWHEFILCTRAYHQYCEENFGKYIHHHPGGEDKENYLQYKKTIRFYQNQFGDPPEYFWGKHTNPNELSCGSCGASQ